MSNQSISSQVIDKLIKSRVADPSTDLVQFSSLVSAHQFKRAHDLIIKYVPKNSSILDWGAGNGHFSYFLVRSGYKVNAFGFDGVPKITKQLDASLFNFVGGGPEDPVHIPFASNQFDAVTSIGVLEHVRETKGSEVASLLEIKRTLKSGGYFICFHFPNKYSWIENLNKFFTQRYGHTWRYTRKDIEEICQKSGLELMHVRRYAILPRNIWGRFPSSIRNSKIIANIYDILDIVIQFPFSFFSQNYLFIAKKP